MKKLTSVVLILVLILSTLFISAFASSQEILLSEKEVLEEDGSVSTEKLYKIVQVEPYTSARKLATMSASGVKSATFTKTKTHSGNNFTMVASFNYVKGSSVSFSYSYYDAGSYFNGIIRNLSSGGSPNGLIIPWSKVTYNYRYGNGSSSSIYIKCNCNGNSVI
ncbi:MAG: hypothetical protein K5917_07310 [Clostridiales bacterium]|nr:hypothetical protein [Clostridiales bacterium]